MSERHHSRRWVAEAYAVPRQEALATGAGAHPREHPPPDAGACAVRDHMFCPSQVSRKHRAPRNNATGRKATSDKVLENVSSGNLWEEG